MSAEVTDSETAECCLLNLSLRAARQCNAGEITRTEYEAIRARLRAAASHLRLVAVALDTPSVVALANGGPR